VPKVIDRQYKPRLATRNVSKSFGPFRALSGVDLEVAPGELHALVGQNGSGKSTLVKILTGYHAPDPGSEMYVDGEAVALPISAVESRRHGLSVVHQSLGLVPERTVTENLRVGRFRAAKFSRRVNWRQERSAAAATLERLGSSISPSALVADLSAEDRATVAIGRALQDHRPGRGLIVFDEATRALTRCSLDRFYEQVRGVIREGASVLMISHRMEEVLERSDRVSVVRDGRLVLAGARTADLDETELVRVVLGRTLVAAAREAGDGRPRRRAVTVQVRGLTTPTMHAADLDVHEGEILGVTGLTGSGYEDIPYALAGASQGNRGTLLVDGRKWDLARSDVRELMQGGIALIPEDRAVQGLAAGLSVFQNITVPRVATTGKKWWTGRKWQRDEVTEFIERLGIKPPDPRATISTLSGGNQQKVLLAKWVASAPRLLLLHEPTQAVDVGARHDIVRALRQLAAGGTCLVVAASDPQELSFLCDRVLVVRDGMIAAELEGDLSQDTIVRVTFGGRGGSAIASGPTSVAQGTMTCDPVQPAGGESQ
jgi:ribose transport system ATP-binding protein